MTQPCGLCSRICLAAAGVCVCAEVRPELYPRTRMRSDSLQLLCPSAVPIRPSSFRPLAFTYALPPPRHQILMLLSFHAACVSLLCGGFACLINLEFLQARHPMQRSSEGQHRERATQGLAAGGGALREQTGQSMGDIAPNTLLETSSHQLGRPSSPPSAGRAVGCIHLWPPTLSLLSS